MAKLSDFIKQPDDDDEVKIVDINFGKGAVSYKPKHSNLGPIKPKLPEGKAYVELEIFPEGKRDCAAIKKALLRYKFSEARIVFSYTKAKVDDVKTPQVMSEPQSVIAYVKEAEIPLITSIMNKDCAGVCFKSRYLGIVRPDGIIGQCLRIEKKERKVCMLVEWPDTDIVSWHPLSGLKLDKNNRYIIPLDPDKDKNLKHIDDIPSNGEDRWEQI